MYEFNPTVEMSTYLACFIISDFTYKEKQINSEKNFRLRVYSTEQQLEKVTYALETGAEIIEYYIKYFKIAYPLPKLGKFLATID